MSTARLQRFHRSLTARGLTVPPVIYARLHARAARVRAKRELPPLPLSALSATFDARAALRLAATVACADAALRLLRPFLPPALRPGDA